MLTYLRRIDRTARARKSLFANIFMRAVQYEERGELPQDCTERRLNRRIFNYWLERCEGGAWPAPDAIDGAQIGQDWRQCFVLDVAADYGFPKFDYLGAGLAAMSGIFLSGQSEWKQTILDKATEQVGRVIKTEKPVVCDDVLTLFNGSRLVFRSVLLPLGKDGQITHVLGAANGRVVEAESAQG